MAFKKFQIQKYPPRLWALVGYPGSGKSTFATQMRTPLLPIDADNRFAEVVTLARGDVYRLSDNPADNTNPEIITRLLNENMAESDVATIVVDSLTAIITPLVTQAVIDNDAGLNKNRIASFKAKALAMRQIQDTVSRWGCGVLWIYHLQDAMDAQANSITRATLSSTERARLYRSLNLELHIVQENERRGVKVVWARRGRSGMTLWDESGMWAGMPEKIESAVYDGLTESDQEQIEKQSPALFPNPEAAIAWGFEQGAFSALQHARNAYQKLRTEKQPKNAQEMATLWADEVRHRLADLALADDQARDSATSEQPALFGEVESGPNYYGAEN
ncbi:MAG: AAA family ATPase [Anaerolineae bacterium]|nr:AAA family ATPase [Anaerolineae bacterium]